LEKARKARSIAEGTALLCEAWMHFAGGETSAGRPGTTRMMFLAVFFCVQKMCKGKWQHRTANPKVIKTTRLN
jgi:hypothetical protein